MRQVVQAFDTGELSVVEVPPPQPRAMGILVRTAASLISAGTERATIKFADKNLLQKARARPDLVKEVWGKFQREGLLTTLDTVRSRLAQPSPLGYSSSGVVIAVGSGAPEFSVGDRVACAGASYACHAEVVYIPRNLAARLDDNVSFEEGAFVTVGAVALQGIRQAGAQLGHNVAVIGLGLVGQLTVQLLKAAGCRVVGVDIDPERVDQALALGADQAYTNENAAAGGYEFSGGHGFDAVVITAASQSNEPLELAAEIARDRGVVVAVGAVGLDIPRKIFYEKELEFRLSRSYGPGRYDPEYEEKGNDYPYGFVRWTEQRNLQAFAQMISAGQVRIQPLISHRFSIGEASRAYEVISGTTGERFTGVLLDYPQDLTGQPLPRKIPQEKSSGIAPRAGEVRLGFLGAGNFATATLMPLVKNIPGVKLVGVASGRGLNARTAAARYGFDYCASGGDDILQDPNVNTVVIVTRHHLHVPQAVAALEAGKNVFVEKPLALSEDDLEAVIAARQAALQRAAAGGVPGPALMVGFNRRFAPYMRELKSRLAEMREPLLLHYRVNAGALKPEHWTHDPIQGGGRLLGEGCHFIDALMFLAGSPPNRVSCSALPDHGEFSRDSFVVTLEFSNGSLGTLTYAANGHKSMGKELLEVFGGGLAAKLDDFRTLRIDSPKKSVSRTSRLRVDKGHRGEWQAFADHLCGRAPAPITFVEIVASTRTTQAALRSVKSGEAVAL